MLISPCSSVKRRRLTLFAVAGPFRTNSGVALSAEPRRLGHHRCLTDVISTALGALDVSDLRHEPTTRHLREVVVIQALDTFGHALVVFHCRLLQLIVALPKRTSVLATNTLPLHRLAVSQNRMNRHASRANVRLESPAIDWMNHAGFGICEHLELAPRCCSGLDKQGNPRPSRI